MNTNTNFKIIKFILFYGSKSNCMVIKIRKKHLEEIFEFARKCYPIEACGILVGKVEGIEKIVSRVYHTKNVLASSFAYRIDPIEMLRVFEETEISGLDVLGFYHSHPFWDSFWSEVDEEKGRLWVGYSYLIVSLTTGNVNSYVKCYKGVEKEELVILP